MFLCRRNKFLQICFLSASMWESMREKLKKIPSLSPEVSVPSHQTNHDEASSVRIQSHVLPVLRLNP